MTEGPATDVVTQPIGAEPATAAARRLRVQEMTLPFVLLALVIAGTIIDADVFLTKDNLLTVLTQASVVGVVAIGMTFVIATGGIDLSVGLHGRGGGHRRRPVRAERIRGVHRRDHRLRPPARAGQRRGRSRGVGSSPSSPPSPC